MADVEQPLRQSRIGSGELRPRRGKLAVGAERAVDPRPEQRACGAPLQALELGRRQSRVGRERLGYGLADEQVLAAEVDVARQDRLGRLVEGVAAERQVGGDSILVEEVREGSESDE